MKINIKTVSIAFALFGASAAVVADEVRLKIASAYPLNIVQIGTQATHLENNLNSVSNGEIKVRLYEAGALVPPLEIFDAVSSGSVDAGWATPGFWQGKESSLALFSSVPFGPGAGEYLAWLFERGGEAKMQAVYEKHNIHSMICGIYAPEASGWFRNEIKSLDDLNGLKMRFFGLGAKVMQKFGVDTQLLAGGDVYPALERGTIDAAEFSMPAVDVKLGFHQIAKHYYFPGWHQQSTTLDLMINKDKWNSMSESQQKIIQMACRANIAYGLAEGEAIQGEALNEIKSKGVQIHTWKPEILEAFESAWINVANDMATEDPSFKDAWSSLQKFRSEYETWGNVGYIK